MASIKWRRTVNHEHRDPCYCMTTVIEPPEGKIIKKFRKIYCIHNLLHFIISADVGSDEEPVFELDQQEWIGTKVTRVAYPEKQAEKYLGIHSFLDPF